MLLTLEEILGWDILADARVITDTFDPATVVENITIMEAPDIGKWVDGNNVLLTGLYSIYDDKRKTAEFLDSLHSGKVCALFVKTRRFVDKVPEVIVETCRRLGIAVVEIPGHIRYIDIMYPVIASIFESRVVQLNYHKETLNTLAGLALGNKGAESIAGAGADLVGNPVLLYDEDMHCLHATDEAFAHAEDSELLCEDVSEEMDYAVHRTRFAGGEGPYRQLLIPIRIFGRTGMYLSLVEQNRPVGKMDFVVLENLVTVLSFGLSKDFAEEELESRFKREIVEDISQGRNLESVKERMAGINLRINAEYAVLLIETSAGRAPAGIGPRLANHNAVRVHDLFLSVKKELHLHGFESYGANTVTAFIEQMGKAPGACADMLEKLARRLMEKAGTAFPSLPLYIGYTSSPRPVARLAEAYKNARDALHISRVLHGENTFCDYEGLGVYKILCLARDRGDLESCVPPSVTRLAAHQQEHGLPLLETLTAYFAHNGNIQRTAKALSIHYKTLYYRLGKVETLTGLDLKNSDETFELQMGLRILRLLQGN